MKIIRISILNIAIIALISGFAQINAQDIFKTVSENKLAELKEIIEKDPSQVNQRDQYNRIALHPAAYNGNYEICKYLIDKGADINTMSLVGTPLHRACFKNNIEVVKLLLDNNVDLTVQNTTGTVMHTVGLTGGAEIAKLLIKKGADINALNNNGISPLYYAISSGANITEDLALLLIEKGADLSVKSPTGESLLQIAVNGGFTDIARLMIEKGADKKILKKNNFQTLLHIAAINGYGRMSRMLINNGLNVDSPDSYGYSPLYYAGKHGNKTVVDELLNNGAKKEKIENNYNPSPYLNRKLKNDDAYIWHMNHRGWVVKTKNNLFVFDNEESGKHPDIPSLHNGFISSSEISDQNVIALYSTYHAYPNTMEFIHTIEDSINNITYLNYKDDMWRGGKNTYYLKGREKKQIGEVEIISLETHLKHGMGSLGYLIKTGGLTFYYSCFPSELTEEYKKEVDYIAQFVDKCDFAFIQLTTGKKDECTNYIIEKLKPKYVFPIAMSSNKLLHKEMAHKIKLKFPEVKALSPENPGKMYTYKNKKIK